MSVELFLGFSVIFVIGLIVAMFIERKSARRSYPGADLPHLQKKTRTRTPTTAEPGAKEWPAKKIRRIAGWKFTKRVEPLRVRTAVLDVRSPTNVPSASDPGRMWNVDLAARTCSCPDFAKRRALHDKEDVRRFCKHAIQVMRDAKLLTRIDALHRAVLSEKYATSYDVVHLDSIGKLRVVMAFTHSGDWVNLFVPSDPAEPGTEATYLQCGYNLRERRWSYGDGPRHIRGASAAIRACFEPIRG